MALMVYRYLGFKCDRCEGRAVTKCSTCDTLDGSRDRDGRAIAEYIVCSCIFLLLNLEKYARSMVFFFFFLVVKFSYFRVVNVTV
jgi:hypothetical protein